jgi:translation initiation factor 2B subunit (eIF-2B alpha/beta/delta family)
MRAFLLMIAGLAAEATRRATTKFSALQIMRDAKAQEMDLDTALRIVAPIVPEEVQELIHAGDTEAALIQLSHHGKVHHHKQAAHALQDPAAAPAAAPADPFTKAVEFINTELVSGQEKVDIIVYDCNVFRTEKEQLLLENSNLLTALGSSIAQATATIANAKGTLTTLNDQLSSLQTEFEDEKRVCAETLSNIQGEMTALQQDLQVAEMVLSIADGECNKPVAAAPFLVQTCTTGAQYRIEGRVGDALDKVTSKAGRAAVQAVLADIERTRAAVAEVTGSTEVDEGQVERDVTESEAERAAEGGSALSEDGEFEDAEAEVAAEKQYQEEDRQRLREDMGVTSFVQRRAAFTLATDPNAPQPKCTTGGKVDCGELLDKVDQMAGDIRVELTAVEDEHAETLADCEQRRGQKETQITDLSQQVAESETILSEATATMLKDTQSQQNAQTEKTTLEQELNTRMDECHKDIKDVESSVCALGKVRNALFKQIKKTNPIIQDCELSDWVEGECSVSCGHPGLMIVTRHVLQQPGENGAACPPSRIERECNNGPCPVDCVMSDWADWSKCTKECGGGVQSHTRNIISEAQHGGQPCEELSSSRACNTFSCDVDCVLDEWTEWGSCSKSCKPAPQDEAGIQFRQRHIKTPSEGNGKCALPNSEDRLQSMECNDELCPENVKCVSALDIVFLYDGSGSVGWNTPPNDREKFFRGEKQFVTNVLSKMDMGWDDSADTPIGVRVAVAQYSTKVHDLNRLAEKKEDQNKEKLLKLVADDKWKPGGTGTSQALAWAGNILKDSTDDRLSVIVLLTDGRPNNQAATEQIAHTLKAQGIRIITVPIGQNVPIGDMCKVSSAPCSQNMVRAMDFDSLQLNMNRYMATFCADLVEDTDPVEPEVNDYLKKGERLFRGQFITSANGKFRALMQKDGNFCIKKKKSNGKFKTYKWCSGTWTNNVFKRPHYVEYQGDDNVVVYRKKKFGGRKAKWHSNTWKKTGSEKLQIQDDGVLALKKADGEVLWSKKR